MSYRELTMIDVREVLRRWQAGQSARQIAREALVDRKTVARYIATAEALKLPRDRVLDEGDVHEVAHAGTSRDARATNTASRTSSSSGPTPEPRWPATRRTRSATSWSAAEGGGRRARRREAVATARRPLGRIRTPVWLPGPSPPRSADRIDPLGEKKSPGELRAVTAVELLLSSDRMVRPRRAIPGALARRSAPGLHQRP